MPTILVVDDSAVDRKLVAGLLERESGWSVQTADNGRTAIELLQPPLPDVIVTDLQMPEMDGLQLVAAVKDDFPFIPVVLLTARGSEQIAADALRLGAASYVPKRRLGDDLLDVVRRVLAAAAADRAHMRLLHYMLSSVQSFELRNSFEHLSLLTAHVQQQLRCLPLGDETERLRVTLAVEEALKNSLLHGNLELQAPQPGSNPEEYRELVRQRASQSPYAERRLYVTLRLSRQEARINIRDEGPGFDHQKLLSTSVLNGHEAASNRGLALMRTILDEISFNASGNEVTLVKRAVTEAAPDEDES
jgi:CheY-like chemotaxis protein/anti-sigma regulatory factor (Ser/Thr protein kinase)